MTYHCICGAEFESSQAFNSHRANCKVYLESTGKWAKRCERLHNAGKKSGLIAKQKAAQQKANKLANWVAEKHRCERCGKVMTEKFGSGRFCCSACANSHKVHSKQQLKSATVTIIQASKARAKKTRDAYEQNPKYCTVCGKALPWEKRYSKTCSEACLKQCLSLFTKANIKRFGGNLNTSNTGYKCGYFNGIYCASSYELAFVVYCIEHNIAIHRNTQGFKYVYCNEEHIYYPDFLVDDCYVEIKNYHNEIVQAKKEYFPKNLNYKIIYSEQMQKYIKYCQKKYGKKYWEQLYNAPIKN